MVLQLYLLWCSKLLFLFIAYYNKLCTLTSLCQRMHSENIQPLTFDRWHFALRFVIKYKSNCNVMRISKMEMPWSESFESMHFAWVSLKIVQSVIWNVQCGSTFISPWLMCIFGYLYVWSAFHTLFWILKSMKCYSFRHSEFTVSRSLSKWKWNIEETTWKIQMQPNGK